MVPPRPLLFVADLCQGGKADGLLIWVLVFATIKGLCFCHYFLKHDVIVPLCPSSYAFFFPLDLLWFCSFTTLYFPFCLDFGDAQVLAQ